MRLQGIKILATCLAAALLLGCSTGTGNFLDSTSSAAKDRIMYVREKPPTFGHFRFQALMARYPDLATFASSKRVPQFLAETNKGDSYYLILYYLDKREAYACRCGTGSSTQVEFSGPYPITDGEAKTLGNLRDGRPPKDR